MSAATDLSTPPPSPRGPLTCASTGVGNTPDAARDVKPTLPEDNTAAARAAGSRRAGKRKASFAEADEELAGVAEVDASVRRGSGKAVVRGPTNSAAAAADDDDEVVITATYGDNACAALCPHVEGARRTRRRARGLARDAARRRPARAPSRVAPAAPPALAAL